jgi:hypothetical protein
LEKEKKKLLDSLIKCKNQVESTMLSKDLFMREINYIVLSDMEKKKKIQDPSVYINILKEKFLEGKPVEIVDGNNNTINKNILS